MDKKPFEVIDRQTKKVVGYYSTMQKARAARDRKDLEYGACRYTAQKRAEA